jgi:Dolichyl-phosphate-mannose-protein mannosyltransferase
MNLTLPKKQASKKADGDSQLQARRNRRVLFSWLFTWDIYLILLVAGFLRLYALNTSEFDSDQAAIFSLARVAVQHGLLPIVSNRASIGIENPPAVIYLLMIPAAVSADPLWATVMIGLFNTVAVLLTYFFTRRYYGRLAALIAALLYAAAAKPLNYSRFLWQQNMLAPLLLLFMFALFWGVVERRKGWLFPALLLIGISYQLHETSTLLAIPLLAAVVLAPGTVRWRDLALGISSLLLIFFPYILWEFSSKFVDLFITLRAAKLPAHFDTDAIYYYRFLLSPNGFNSYYQLPTSLASVLRRFAPILGLLRYTLQFLVLGGLATVGVQAFWTGRNALSHTLPHKEAHAKPLSLLRNWWTVLRATPYRCGLVVLFIWQVVPLLILTRRSVTIYPYYLLILMPGPFILAGFFIGQLLKWMQPIGRIAGFTPEVSSSVPDKNGATPVIGGAIPRGHPFEARNFLTAVLRYTVYFIVAFAAIAQFMTATATLVDAAQGYNGHGKTFNDLRSLQQALGEADHLAQQRHLNRVYITTDANSETALRYLAQQMQTPTTLFDDSGCFVLPNPAEGPAVLLTSPYAELTKALLGQYAATTLIDQPARLGAQPFNLYIVSPNAALEKTSLHPSFVDNLQLVNVQRQQLNIANRSWLVSRWNLLRSAQPVPRTTYTYAITALPNSVNKSVKSQCTFNAMRPGDQLFVAFALPGNAISSAPVTIKGLSFTTTPYNPAFGPLLLETDKTQDSPVKLLRTAEGKDSITIPLAESPF